MAAPMKTLSFFLADKTYLLRRVVTYSGHYCRSLCTSKSCLNVKEDEFMRPKAVVIKENRKDPVGHIMQMYEDLVGLTEVKTAQDKVVEAEKNFLKMQEDRRALQLELTTIQSELRTIGTELEKTHRTDPCYIDLVKKEHGILVVEKDMTNKLKTADKFERDLFSLLSACVRESHEKERGRAERTKYWSIIGSIIGAIIGITGSAINNHKRLKEMRAIVRESGESTAEYKEIADKFLASLSTSSPSHMFGNNSEGIKESFDTDLVKLEKLQHQTDIFYENINTKTTEILSNLEGVIKMTSTVQSASDLSQHIVYVGPEVKSLLHETELRLEKTANKNLIVSLFVTGGVITLAISLVTFFFKGS